jgi:hypothetical protein
MNMFLKFPSMNTNLVCFLIAIGLSSCKFLTKSSQIESILDSETLDCIKHTEAESLPSFQCAGVPETAKIRSEGNPPQYELAYDSTGRIDQQKQVCLNPSSIPGLFGGCGDGGTKITTYRWKNKQDNSIYMVIQCSSFTDSYDGMVNVIVTNIETKKACFLRKRKTGWKGNAESLIEQNVSCVGCHQPYLFISSPLVRSEKLESKLSLGNNSLSLIYKKPGFDVTSGVLDKILGMPSELSRLSFALSETFLKSSKLYHKSNEAWTPFALDLSAYPALRSSCGSCHALSANPNSLKLASIVTGHCKTRLSSDTPCLGFDMEAYAKIPNFENIHKFVYDAKPFRDSERAAVFGELTKALETCKNYHAPSAACARVQSGATVP